MKNGRQVNAPEFGEEDENFIRLWWGDRSKNEKRLLIGALIFVILLILSIMMYFIIANEPEVCHSPACVKASKDVLDYADLSADPCDDFYRFTCGNFPQQQKRPETRADNRASRLSPQTIMVEQIRTQIRNMLEVEPLQGPPSLDAAKKFYRACMNVTAVEAVGLKGIKRVFEEIGGWPTLAGDNWRESQFDWKDAIYRLRSLGINFEFFLTLAVERDTADPTRYILNLKDPSYKPSEVGQDVKAMYLGYMEDVAVEFGASRSVARREQNEVMQFLLTLAKISEEAAGVNGTKAYNPLSLSELEYEFPGIPWPEYINRILDPASRITHDDVISVSEPEYLKKLLGLLKNTNKRIIANFLSWHTVQQLIKYLPARILNKAYEYLDKVNGKSTREARWSLCLRSTQNKLNAPVAAAYTSRNFDEGTRLSATSMIRHIKYQFGENLKAVDWLDEKTKELSLSKVVSSVEDITSFNNLMEESRVYDEVQVFEDELLTSVLNLDYVNTNLQYARIGQGPKSIALERPGFAFGLDMAYTPADNLISIPVGLFQGLYFQKDRPMYLNFGLFGSMIAHEIYHVIIQAEYRRESKGEVRSWWSPRSLSNYDGKLECLTKRRHSVQLNSTKIEQHLNTSDVRDEFMADLAGMKVSYDTYVNWVQENGLEPRLPGLNYSPNQLFWISTAIRHCTKYAEGAGPKQANYYWHSPDQVRVNDILKNTDDFSWDFRCPAGSKMNPPDKCHVW